MRLPQRLGYGHRFINERMLALEKTSFTREDKVDYSRSLSFGDLEGLPGVIQEKHPLLLLTQEGKRRLYSHFAKVRALPASRIFLKPLYNEHFALS